MPDRRPIGDLKRPNRRPTCPIKDRHAASKTDMAHQRRTCPIKCQPMGDPPETDMSDQRPIRELNMPYRRPPCLIGDLYACREPSEIDMPAESYV